MSRQIQIRRGTSAEHAMFTGAMGEITMDTTNKTLRVHDGETVGGIAMARSDHSADYIIAWQQPSTKNGYTWYRKYKSGWIEQGGIGTVTTPESPYVAQYPIQMRDSNYVLCAISKSPTTTSGDTDHGCHYVEKTPTYCRIISLRGNSGNWITNEVCWHICGFCAN